MADLYEDIYSLRKENWYQAKPYAFKFTDRNNNVTIMYLPISPSNLNISTDFATNMVTTLYGTVEEHSDVRYYDIIIEGTTGAVPRYVNPVELGQDDPRKILATGMAEVRDQDSKQYGRSYTKINLGKTSAALGGFFRKTQEYVSSIKNKVTDILGSDRKRQFGVDEDRTGYLAFHNLYRFLLKYKKEASGLDGGKSVRKNHPLKFLNYKDNNEYNVVVRNFVLRRSAENPTLYYYQIVMRGYDLKSLNVAQSVDSLLELKSELGLAGIDSKGLNGSNTLTNIALKANKVRSTLASIASGIRLFGR